VIIALAAGIAASPVAAADAAHPATGDSSVAGFPVSLGGIELFRIRVGNKGGTAAERAALLSSRFERSARDPAFAPESIRVVEGEISSVVISDDRDLMSVIDADTVGTGATRQELARRRAEVLRTAVTRHRAERSSRGLALALLWALLSTLGLAVAVTIIRRSRARVGVAMRRWFETRRDKIRPWAGNLLELGRVGPIAARLIDTLGTLLVFVLIYVYAGVVLGLFPATRPVSGRLASFVLEPFRILARGFVDHLPGLIFVAVLILVTNYVITLVRLVFAEIESGRMKFAGFYPEWAPPTYRLVRILIVALAVVVAYPYIPGSNTNAFKGVSILIGILVSLGSGSTISNVISGIAITYMRSFQVGDVVRVGEHLGRVMETTMFVTRIRTPKNVEINIPNSVILGSNVVNYSAEVDKGNAVIVHSEVTIGYQWPWRQVHALMVRAAERTEGVLKEPGPFVLQRSLDDFGVRYEINVFTDQPHRMEQIRSQLHRNMQDEFNEYGVEIMTPAYEGDRAQPTLAPKEQWYAAPAKRPGEPGADE
jgi:small-conductance mechanosensitive channel